MDDVARVHVGEREGEASNELGHPPLRERTLLADPIEDLAAARELEDQSILGLLFIRVEHLDDERVGTDLAHDDHLAPKCRI